MNRILSICIISVVLLSFSCDENNNFVLFSTDNDVELGQQVHAEISNDPSFKILPKENYPEVYDYLYNMRDAVLNSGEVAYREKFAW